MRRLYIIVVVALAMSLMASAAPAAAPAAYEPPGGATFNVPRPWGTDAERYRIVRTVEEAIRQTRPTKKDKEPFILITSFLFDRKPTRRRADHGVQAGGLGAGHPGPGHHQPLLAAHHHGAQRRQRQGPQPRRPTRHQASARPLQHQAAQQGQGRQRRGRAAAPHDVGQGRGAQPRPPDRGLGHLGQGRQLRQALRRQLPRRRRQHALASSTSSRTPASAKNVVMVSSSNLNRGGAVLGLERPLRHEEPPQERRRLQVRHPPRDDRGHQAPVNKVAGHRRPVHQSLLPDAQGVAQERPDACRTSTRSGCRSAIGRTQINISMFYWKGPRGDYLANKLLSPGPLRLRGQHHLRRSLAGDRRAAAGGGDQPPHQPLRQPPRLQRRRRTPTIRTHGKYILVKGTVRRSDRSPWQVWTGTAELGGRLAVRVTRPASTSAEVGLLEYLTTGHEIRNHSDRLPFSEFPPPDTGHVIATNQRVFLHVGTPKSGTTFLQRAALEEPRRAPCRWGDLSRATVPGHVPRRHRGP